MPERGEKEAEKSRKRGRREAEKEEEKRGTVARVFMCSCCEKGSNSIPVMCELIGVADLRERDGGGRVAPLQR